ncbi:MAG TPA: septum formation initiator family protein [Bacillota bacterium]|nr:septum formation initiator family protein [Bacillota bacterium]
MLTKIKHYQKVLIGYVGQLRDLRVLGMLLFLTVALMVSWSSVKAIDTNYGLQKRISELEQQNAVRQLANDNLKLQNGYYRTPQYLELAARQDFGMAAPGETVLLVPQAVAMAHTVTLPQDQAKTAEVVKPKAAYRQHLEAWQDFLFHKEPSSTN